MKEAFPYEDLVNLPHHQSKKHPQMSMHDRAAQFGAFAALTGHEEAIKATERMAEEEMMQEMERVTGDELFSEYEKTKRDGSKKENG